ncbi:NUDIX hydrolase [Apibacter sp. HY039]|uniref:NUDIX hydrolase n=1 Tax=Apibacter sp. HY039 TaxID=2501476 RepID=UPI000FEB7B17|nr:NUDIX domain-containing protein [Apibacter sp. HY039]
MYKIFVNDKLLTIGKKEVNGAVNLHYKTKTTFESAFDLLFNTDKEHIHIYHSKKNKVWEKFQNFAQPVYAAGGIVRNKDNNYLFIKRNGLWDLPKGHVEKKESFENAAVREVEEECSISDLKLGKFASVTYHVYFDKRYYLKVVYWFHMKYKGTAKPKPQKEENIEIVNWFSKDKIPKLMKNTYGNIRELTQNQILNNKK